MTCCSGPSALFMTLPISSHHVTHPGGYCSTERPAAAAAASQITGVKHVAMAARRTDSDAMALVYDIDVRWAGAPDISLLLAPSRKWIVKQRRIGADNLICGGVPPAHACGSNMM